MRHEPFEQARASQTEDVYEQLRAALLEWRYLPDQKLKASELCADFHGSLGAVREALSRLRAEGLVVSESYRGFYVAPVSPSDLKSLTRARIEIERLCLASSLANGDPEWEGRLVALYHQLTRHSPADPTVGAIQDWSRLHTAFHDVLVSACENPWLLRMHRMLHEQSERYRHLALKLNAGLEPLSRKRIVRDTAKEHKDLLDAALAHDVGRMNELMAAHLLRTEKHLLTQLQLGGLVDDDAARSVADKLGRAAAGRRDDIERLAKRPTSTRAG
jgi:GntR family carbon starvation induced transcriptional regulator